MSSESDFEQVSLGGIESEAEHEDTKEDVKESVYVELPPALLHQQKKRQTSTTLSDLSSVASSFIPVKKMSALDIASKASDYDEDSWSNLDNSNSGQSVSSGWSTFPSDVSTSSASSTISGFDLLSINGSSLRTCNRCSHCNAEGSGICMGCGVALLANPCSAT